MQNNPALLNTAQATNSALMPSNIVEKHQKAVNAVYLNFLDSGFTYTPADLNTLRQIAVLCPYTDGTAVWEARALLAGVDTTKYSNACEVMTMPALSTGARMAHTESMDATAIVQNAKTAIYPNPNAGSFTVSYAGNGNQINIEVYTTLGSLIISKQYTIENNLSTTAINNLEEGTYMVRLTVDGNPVRIERIVVTK